MCPPVVHRGVSAAGYPPIMDRRTRAARPVAHTVDMFAITAGKRRVAAPLLLAAMLTIALGSGPAAAAPVDRLRHDSAHPRWEWPLAGAREIVQQYRAPAHDYGPGHRGIDVAAASGASVSAPADGVVAFRGVVVDRPLLTIDHGDGYITTLEPLRSALRPGETVDAGETVGVVAAGGHTDAGALHIGVRLEHVYINPMLMFGPVPRAVLLPCCEAL